MRFVPLSESISWEGISAGQATASIVPHHTPRLRGRRLLRLNSAVQTIPAGSERGTAETVPSWIAGRVAEQSDRRGFAPTYSDFLDTSPMASDDIADAAGDSYTTESEVEPDELPQSSLSSIRCHP